MSGQIASFKPGDNVPVTYFRNGKEFTVSVTLKNTAGTANDFVSSSVSELLGTDLETIDKKKAAQFGIDGGVLVKKIKQGGAFSKTRMQEGFIITSVNETAVSSIESLTNAIRNYDRAYVYFEGIYPEAPGAIYRYPLMLED